MYKFWEKDLTKSSREGFVIPSLERDGNELRLYSPLLVHIYVRQEDEAGHTE